MKTVVLAFTSKAGLKFSAVYEAPTITPIIINSLNWDLVAAAAVGKILNNCMWSLHLQYSYCLLPAHYTTLTISTSGPHMV